MRASRPKQLGSGARGDCRGDAELEIAVEILVGIQFRRIRRQAHNAHEEAWARAVAGAKPPTGFLAMTAMSGAPESWYMSAYPTWAAYEAANKAETPALAAIGKQYSAKEDEFLSDGRGMVLTFRADLSYGPPPTCRRAGTSP